MRIAIMVGCLLFFLMLSGCTIPDAMLALFGDKHYSGGGITRDEKLRDIDRHVEASQNYGGWNR